MSESELLTRAQCSEIFAQVEAAARAAGADKVELILGVNASALTRFANNAIHQNVAEERRTASVRVVIGKRTARAATNRLDSDSLRRVAESAVEITRSQEPDPDLPDLAAPEEYDPVDRFCPSTAQSTPEDRAGVVRDAISIIEAAGQTAAGIYSTSQAVECVLNSRGVMAYYFDSTAQFAITAVGESSSGWAKASGPDCGEIDALALARRASDKARLSDEPRALEPGRYTVILEPSAVQDLLGQMFFDFSGTAIEDKRSFLTGRIGKQLFGADVNIADDVYHPLQTGAPFDAEGVPRRRLALVDAGCPREVAWSRQAAYRAGGQPTGHGFPVPNEYGEAPMNIVMEGGGQTLEQIVAATARGILVTRLWYIREVDPYEKIMTGLTRDGTFLVEGGRIVAGLRNLRFNQSLIELLNHVDAVSPAERASGEESFDMVVPALRARDFNFTETTKY